MNRLSYSQMPLAQSDPRRRVRFTFHCLSRKDKDPQRETLALGDTMIRSNNQALPILEVPRETPGDRLIRRATSATARFMAQRENGADLLGATSLLNLKDKDPMLAGVIFDISMNATIAVSLQLGSTILRSLAGITTLHQKRVEQHFYAIFITFPKRCTDGSF